jgi:hypothetical protein
MRRSALLLGGATMLVVATSALTAQESLLPPGFDNPAPARPAPQRTGVPAPARSAATTPARSPQASAETTSAPVGASTPVVQPLPGQAAGSAPGPVSYAGGVSDQALLDSIDPALLAKLIDSARPKFDIPPAGQRSLDVVGVVAESDGGLPVNSTHFVNGNFVEGVLAKTNGRFVSRWGHILARRVLASRLATPVGMNGADWAAARAQLLLRMGEADLARSMVQSVDSGNFTRSLEDAAMGSFLATADPVGLCPITALTAARRPGWDWDLVRSICSAFSDEGSTAMSQLDRALRRGAGAKIDILLAQKFAGAATNARRAVKIEWDGVEALTPWSIGLSFATGLEPPQQLREKAGASYSLLAARAPMLPLASRAQAADVAAARGQLSARAMVDLYSELYALREGEEADEQSNDWSSRAEKLRAAYTAASATDRVDAIRSVWGDAEDPDRAYAGLVMTAYAAARVVPAEPLADQAAPLISSMLAAGLDRSALKWAPWCPVGSEAWGLLVLANPGRASNVGAEALRSFRDGDDSADTIRSRFLLAGLMGLERIDAGAARDVAGTLGVDFNRQTRWTRAISDAAASGNPALVGMLAAFGMQSDRWDKMTPLHLYHIVSALHRVGLDAEARMIAAEAVSRV